MILREEQQPAVNATNEKHSLYLRFPKKLSADRTLAETEVKSLHSKIIRVRIPRQRSANFCLIDFESKDVKEKALKSLKKIDINGKRLVVKEAVRNDKVRLSKKIEKIKVKRELNEALGQLVGDIKNSLLKDYAQRNVTNVVMIKYMKSGTTQADIRQLFPEAIDIKLNIKAERKNSFALIWLPSPKDARAATERNVQINGEEFVVILQNEGKQKKRKRTKDSNEKSIEEEDGSSGESVKDEVEDENVDSDDESD